MPLEMGALVTRALRPLRSFNIENRAHRVISKEKPTPAPQYQQAIEDIKRTMAQDPQIDEKLSRKDLNLDNMLKEIYVTSQGRPEDDITRERRQSNPNRPLPDNRRQPEDFEYGFKEPERIPYGRVTLRKAIEFISAHQTNPSDVTADKIATEYKLKLEDVINTLQYFKSFEIYLPKTKKTPATFAGPAELRKKLIAMKQLELDSQNKQVKEEINTPEIPSFDIQTKQPIRNMRKKETDEDKSLKELEKPSNMIEAQNK